MSLPDETENRVTCVEEATGWLLRPRPRLWLCGTEVGRLLWLSLTKRTKPGPGLFLLLLWDFLRVLYVHDQSGNGNCRER